MKTSLTYSVVALLMVLTSNAISQRKTEYPQHSIQLPYVRSANSTIQEQDSRQSISRNFMFNSVVVALKNGDAIMGLLTGLSEDTLFVLRKEKTERIALRDVSRMRLERDPDTSPSKAGIFGLLLGAYGGDLAALRARHQPFAYVQRAEWPLALWSILFGALGGGIGYLVGGAATTKEEVFDFTGTGGVQTAELARFRKLVFGEQNSRLIHLFFLGSQVSSRMSAAGIESGSYGYGAFFYDSYSPTSSFNMMRRLELTYSFTPEIEAGVSLVWFGEPTWSWGSNYYYYASNYSYTLEQFKAFGYHGVGYYKPFRSSFPKSVDWKIGIGLGISDVDFLSQRTDNIWDSTATPYPTYRQNVTTNTIHENATSVLLSTQLDLYLYEGLSIGFVADYVYVPNKLMPEVPGANVPARDLGNASIGFALGMHF